MKRRRKQQGPVRGRQRRSVHERDPYFEREQARYEHPVPSREYILQTLEAQSEPTSET
ncbi:MAG: hypothetical protein GTO41_02355, partial [Burkholderiales bacterium]|nr:hypothetical protein [Burkholderiales bacterium]